MRIWILLLISLHLTSHASASLTDQREDAQFLSYDSAIEKNIEIIDWNNPARNQGAVGSCQSFAFLGVIESQVYRNQGVTLDLSERYQLYSNFMEFSALGSAPQHIVQFPMSFAKWGALPESLYPYSAVDQNQAVFQQDSAQGITSSQEPLIDRAIKGTNLTERSHILQEPQFFGPLPDREAPVHLPVAALAMQAGKPTRYVQSKQTGDKTACFSVEDDKASDIWLTPQQFAYHCLEYDSQDLVSVSAIERYMQTAATFCEMSPEEQRASLLSVLDLNRQSLELVLRGLQVEQSSLIAFSVPESPEDRVSALWRHQGTATTAGHAVVAVGYLLPEQVMDPSEQEKGLLGSGLFDALAEQYDSSYQKPSLALSPAELALHRQNSQLGQALIAEQGVVIVRNSWDDVVGLNGYQAITLDYFLNNGFMSLSTGVHALESGQPPAIQITEDMVKEALAKVSVICTAPPQQ